MSTWSISLPSQKQRIKVMWIVISLLKEILWRHYDPSFKEEITICMTPSPCFRFGNNVNWLTTHPDFFGWSMLWLPVHKLQTALSVVVQGVVSSCCKLPDVVFGIILGITEGKVQSHNAVFRISQRTAPCSSFVLLCDVPLVHGCDFSTDIPLNIYHVIYVTLLQLVRNRDHQLDTPWWDCYPNKRQSYVHSHRCELVGMRRLYY